MHCLIFRSLAHLFSASSNLVIDILLHLERIARAGVADHNGFNIAISIVRVLDYFTKLEPRGLMTYA